MENDNDLQICQHGKTILSGDKISIGIIFNNLTGKNFKDNPSGYRLYQKFAQSQGFDLNSVFHKCEDDKILETGHFTPVFL